MIRRPIDNVMTYYQRPVINAVNEGLNNQIQKINRMACGSLNAEQCKTAINFY